MPIEAARDALFDALYVLGHVLSGVMVGRLHYPYGVSLQRLHCRWLVMNDSSLPPLGLVLAVLVFFALVVLALRVFARIARRLSGAARREAGDQREHVAALRAPDWEGYEAWLGWSVPEAFKAAYARAATQTPPLLALASGGYLLEPVRAPGPTDEEVAIAWSEDGAPVYFKRGIVHANTLYAFADGEEAVLVDDAAIDGSPRESLLAPASGACRTEMGRAADERGCEG
jgi:hypothetical protein